MLIKEKLHLNVIFRHCEFQIFSDDYTAEISAVLLNLEMKEDPVKPCLRISISVPDPFLFEISEVI